MSKMQILIDSVINWFRIPLIKDYFKSAREKIYDAINYGYKKLGGLSSSLLQISHKYRNKLGKRTSSDERSLIRKSDNYYKRKKPLKVLHTTISEYWRDVLFNHWFILTQCLILAVIIIVSSPWIGSDCNSGSTYEESYFDHRPDLHLRQFRRNIDERASLISQNTCGFLSLFSSGKDPQDFKRRSGILRRKRMYRRFY